MSLKQKYIADLVLVCDGEGCDNVQNFRFETDQPFSMRQMVAEACDRFGWHVVFMRPRLRRGRAVARAPRAFCPTCRRPQDAPRRPSLDHGKP